ncbi:RNA-binding protein 33 isoform X2 [Electrophorus electricus]|uniref:RNA-binding protein 33 isoform X2 n=1 Tax=Electrophorus electricus TaxID=8005 RepID=UPI0015D0188E|nr:RNA-binding protein 33 isoform X2 [Electrophorus electricus]
MAANTRDDEFDEYDKPGAERSRRRRGEDDDLDSDLEGDLLEEDWLLSKKNASELSDEELNDDLLQSDEEDQNTSGQGEAVSLNVSSGLSTSYDLQGKELDEGDYTGEGYELTEGEQGEGFSQEEEEYGVDKYGHEEDMEYTTTQNDEGYEDEVLDLQINEPLDDEFQVDDYSGEYGAESQEEQTDQQEMLEGVGPEEEGEGQDNSLITESEEVEAEAEPEVEIEVEQEADTKEESDEDEEDNEESGRQRFKTERKDVTVVRLSDAASKRRNIPETLELTEEAKADLLEFEEKERVRKQGRFGGRGRIGGVGGRGVPLMGTRGRGGGRGVLPLFGMGDFRGDGSVGKGRINEHRPPLMQVNLGMQPRMAPQQSHHHQSRPRGGPGLFANPVGPLSQQPLQLLMPHRSPGPLPPLPRPQPELHRPRGMSTPPPPAHANQQPKNIHINPHFRGPSSSPVQVPLMAPAQNQPRPNIGPQRFPGPVDFQQHLQGNFVQPQRPPPQEQWRGPPPLHQERDTFFGSEPRFPAQHMFDLPGPAPLMNNNVLPLGGPGPLSFPPPGGLGSAPGPGLGFGPLAVGQGQGPGGGGMFQREPQRGNLPPHNAGPPAPPGPRGFMGQHQPFAPQQQGPPFSPQHMPFGLQSIMQPHSQPQHHDPPLSHAALHQHHHRQDVPPQGHPQPLPLPPHNQHEQQRQPGEQHPIMHLSHPPFRQPLQGGPRQMQLRPQSGLQRNNPGRMRMVSPSPLQQLHNAPQRNSNLRELPIATSHATTAHPSQPTIPSRPITRAGQDMRPSQGVVGGAVGRGRGMAKSIPPTITSETKKASPVAQPSMAAQEPDEDEETRQYRLKIEEQKRLREEVLRRKEMRRQMQAGVRKKELLERIGSQTQTALAPPTASQPPPASTQPPQPVPSLAPNGAAPNTPPALRPSVKSRLQSSSTEPQTSRSEPIQKTPWQQQGRPMNPQNPLRQGPPLPNLQSGGAALADAEGSSNTQSGQPQPIRPGGKRTVMQRTSSAGFTHIPPKVRVVKRLGEAGPNPSTPPQQQQQQQQQPIGRPAPQQRLGAIRKVTVATSSAPQQQEAGCGMANQTNRVVVPGLGRGRGAPGGRGGGRVMMPANRQSPRGPDLQPSTVSIDGLSSSTTEKQIKNLLNSIGPIQMFKMLPQQRKAIAKFVNPQHALSFQHSFHRHMIDLSHIDVTIIDG